MACCAAAVVAPSPTQDKKLYLALDCEGMGSILKILWSIWTRAYPWLRRYALSYFALFETWALILTAHVQWGTLTDDGGRGEAVSAFGAWTVVFGIAVAGRPYVRAGIRGAAEAQVPAPFLTPLLDSDGIIVSQIEEGHRKRVEEVLPDVVAERVIAVAVIIVGTLTNGYGAPIGRLLSFLSEPLS